MNNANKKKRFHWFKLKLSFLTSDKVDIMMSQKSKNGANYIVIYQILCLMTLNTNGELATHVNGITMKWDDEKIQRECKWFDIDTIRIAKGLFLELGLLVLNDNGNLEIKDHHELIGYETGSAIDAKRKRVEKAKQNTIKKGNTKNVS
jgi:hypothetical protein